MKKTYFTVTGDKELTDSFREKVIASEKSTNNKLTDTPLSEEEKRLLVLLSTGKAHIELVNNKCIVTQKNES